MKLFVGESMSGGIATPEMRFPHDEIMSKNNSHSNYQRVMLGQPRTFRTFFPTSTFGPIAIAET
jgi:hypothetical protein